MTKRCFILILGLAFCGVGCEPPPLPPPTTYERAAAHEMRDRAAEADLERLGARLQPETSGTAVMLTDADTSVANAVVKAAARLMDLSSLSLVNSQPSVGWVRRLRGAPHLQHVVLSGVNLSANDITALRSLPRLRSLHLIEAGLTDGAIAHIAEHAPALDDVTIARDDITDDGALWLERLNGLRTLRMVQTPVSGQRITKLLIENPRLIVELGAEGDEVKGGYADR